MGTRPTTVSATPDAPAPVWAASGDADLNAAPGSSRTPEVVPLGRVRRSTRRPRSGLLFALLAFYCMQLAASVLAWREAPIRTEALVDPIRAWALCAALVLPALVLRGRWRALPALIATVAGTVAPLVLSRDLMEVVGPRNVWVGQSLTVQVVFPLVVGLSAVVAVLTAPRRVAAHRIRRNGADSRAVVP